MMKKIANHIVNFININNYFTNFLITVLMSVLLTIILYCILFFAIANDVKKEGYQYISKVGVEITIEDAVEHGYNKFYKRTKKKLNKAIDYIKNNNFIKEGSFNISTLFIALFILFFVNFKSFLFNVSLLLVYIFNGSFIIFSFLTSFSYLYFIHHLKTIKLDKKREKIRFYINISIIVFINSINTIMLIFIPFLKSYITENKIDVNFDVIVILSIIFLLSLIAFYQAFNYYFKKIYELRYCIAKISTTDILFVFLFLTFLFYIFEFFILTCLLFLFSMIFFLFLIFEKNYFNFNKPKFFITFFCIPRLRMIYLNIYNISKEESSSDIKKEVEEFFTLYKIIKETSKLSIELKDVDLILVEDFKNSKNKNNFNDFLKSVKKHKNIKI